MIRWLKKQLYSWLSHRFMHGCSNYNDRQVRRNCRSKEQGRNKFATADIPHARGLVFFNPWRAHRFARKYGFPLVIKPNVSGYSRGSYFPINNYRELWQAMALARLWWPTTVVEQYLKGANYRVVTVKGRIMSAIRRYPPFVVGNGVDAIADLIDAENAVREQMQLYGGMFPIKKDQRIRRHLQKNGYRFSSIPAPGEHVELFHRVALAPGGIIETVETDSIHPDNLALFLRTIKLFQANILGIDVIFANSIEQSCKEQQCIFLEVNSRPYLVMHDYPRYGKKQNLAPYYAELNQIKVEQPHIL